MLRPLVMCLLLLAPVGCALATDPGGDSLIERLARDGGILSVDREAYSHGDTAVVRLVNELDQSLGYNLCLSAREYWTGSEWRRIEPLRSCVAALFGLEEGEETLHEEPITGEWEPGRYRMVTSVELMEEGKRLEVFSESFTVTR